MPHINAAIAPLHQTYRGPCGRERLRAIKQAAKQHTIVAGLEFESPLGV